MGMASRVGFDADDEEEGNLERIRELVLLIACLSSLLAAGTRRWPGAGAMVVAGFSADRV